jgi:pimeloyl-ACP methyl ester carboxylesterase
MSYTVIILVAAVVLPVLLLAGMLIFGTASPPPTLASVYDHVAALDTAGAPPSQKFKARDGVALAYRRYPAGGRYASNPEAAPVTVLIHGSTASSRGMHPMAAGLAARGTTVYAPDIRGHGGSGRIGDVDYLGQLDDDMADLVADIRRQHPSAPLGLVGFSSGGGFVLRIAGGPLGKLFQKYVLLAPYLGHEAPTNHPGNGGWASPYVPRILALTLLNRLGIRWFDGLPAVAFAPRPDPNEPVPTYSFRLQSNFRPGPDYRADLRNVRGTMTVMAGETDDEMIGNAYAPAVHAVRPDIAVHVLPGLSHMPMSYAPAAIAATAEALGLL